MTNSLKILFVCSSLIHGVAGQGSVVECYEGQYIITTINITMSADNEQLPLKLPPLLLLRLMRTHTVNLPYLQPNNLVKKQEITKMCSPCHSRLILSKLSTSNLVSLRRPEVPQLQEWLAVSPRFQVVGFKVSTICKLTNT